MVTSSQALKEKLATWLSESFNNNLLLNILMFFIKKQTIELV